MTGELESLSRVFRHWPVEASHNRLDVSCDAFHSVEMDVNMRWQHRKASYSIDVGSIG